FYHNPSSEPRQANPSFPRLTLQLASASSEIKLGPEEKNVASATERKWEPQVEEERSLQYRAHIAAALFALALLLLIGMVLRWRRGKRHHKYRSPRIYNVK
ncbi:MAG: hypothetical protein LDL33_08430, partial [Desulfomonile sp.]|nr:hypothetical protein [Desulfomonile sp.]